MQIQQVLRQSNPKLWFNSLTTTTQLLKKLKQYTKTTSHVALTGCFSAFAFYKTNVAVIWA